ncbi:MAG: sigma-54-dependent transcriptional regulator [Caldimonas sp.]
MRHVLIVDEDRRAADAMAALTADAGFTCATAGSLREAHGQIALQRPDIVFVDLQLPDGSGLQLLEEAGSLADAEIVLVARHPSLDSSLAALRLHAADYLAKPVSERQLQAVLKRLAPPAAFDSEAVDLDADVDEYGHFGQLWGRAPAMRAVYDRIARVSRTAASVLISGESGTGKEVVAKTLHDLSRRRGEPFLAVNCGAISPRLMESELFGHEKGSFTGADRQHVGYFEQANGGTLLLDEVTEMPPELQVKLLRVLETGTIARVGSSQPREVDVRIVAATNKDPQACVAAGTLRDDLFYRLNVFPIELPPLRERPEDVGLIASHFLRQISSIEGKPKAYTAEALASLATYAWPGNVRELRNIVYRAYLMARGGLIGDACLPRDEAAEAAPSKAPAISLPLGTSLKDARRRVMVATFEHLGQRETTAAILGISGKSLSLALKDHAALQRDAEGSPPTLQSAG